MHDIDFNKLIAQLKAELEAELKAKIKSEIEGEQDVVNSGFKLTHF